VLNVSLETHTLGHPLSGPPIQSALVTRALGAAEYYPLTLDSALVLVMNGAIVGTAEAYLDSLHPLPPLRTSSQWQIAPSDPARFAT
jgi:hypothetical protein